MPKTPRTISEKQHLANLANALLSTGPKSEAGKVRAAMNARRHGLTGQFYVMNEPDRQAYNTFEKGILDVLKPVGPYETQYAVLIAQDHWRLNRSHAIENNTYGLGHSELEDETDAPTPEIQTAVTQAKTWRDHNPAFTNIPLYETRITRMIARNEKRLEELQAARNLAEAEAAKEAELLLCQSVMDGEQISEDNPIIIPASVGLIATNIQSANAVQVNGFVFSPDKLITLINRRTSLERARFYQKRGWDNSIPWNGAFNFPVKTAGPMPKAA